MSVVFRGYSERLASTRLRAIIPAQQLHLLGVEIGGKDWLVLAKHNWDWDEQTHGFARVCYDVCDDWFGHETWGPHYLNAVQRADLVTCNTPVMAGIIAKWTGVRAVVIPDPYEEPELPARVGERLLWFGFKANLADLAPVLQSLEKWEKEIVSNMDAPGITEWSPRAMEDAWSRAGLVIIPTGPNKAKSNNRAVAAIRRGLYPICGVLPAYAELGVWQGDIAAGVEWALSHRHEVLKRISDLQPYVRSEFSPARIGKMWRAALEL